MLWKYTIQYLRKHKARTLLSIIFMTSLLEMMLGVNIFASYKDCLKEAEAIKESGTWQVRIPYIVDSKLYENEPHVLIKYCQTEDLSERLNLIHLEGDFETVMSYHILEGRMPETDDEIAISLSGLKKIGSNAKVNDMVETPFGTFKLVGITNYTKTKLNYFYPDFLCNDREDVGAVDLVLAGQKNMELIDQITTTALSEPTFKDAKISNGIPIISESLDLFYKDIYYVGEIILVGLCGYVLMMNYTYLGLKKRAQDYVLLRGVGALKRQLYMIAVLETSILFVLSIPFGLIIGYLTIHVFDSMSELVHFEALLNIPRIVFHIFITYIIVLIANCRPVMRSINLALSGTFDNQEDTLVIRPVRKLKKISLFTLSKIQLKSQMRNAAFLMVVLIGIFTSLMMVMNTNLKMHIEIDRLDREIENVEINRYDIEELSKEEIIAEGLDYLEIPYIRPNSIESTVIYTDEASRFLLMDVNSIEKVQGPYEIIGRIPEKENEIFAINLFDENEIGATVTINGNDYQVCGSFKPLYTSYAFSIYDPSIKSIHYPMKQKGFFGFFDVQSKSGDTIPFVRYIGNPITNSKIATALSIAQEDFINEKNIIKETVQEKTPYYFICATFLVFMYILSHMQKITAIQDKVMEYRNIGLTRLEILKIYVIEAFMINDISLIFGIFLAYSFGSFVSLKLMGLFAFSLFIVFSLIYLMPVILSIYSKENKILSFKE